jgi:hypothetical protein
LLPEYPFIEEKYGMVQGDFAGMEHQTITFFPIQPNPATHYSMQFHEIVHSWFGNMITCDSWSHIWLGEGLATYMEAYWHEHLGGIEAYNNRCNTWQEYFMDYTGSVYVRDTTNISAIFNDNTYWKAALVLHMIRGLEGRDAILEILNAFASNPELMYKNATTEDFIATVEEVTGEDWDWFFEQWIYGYGVPNYEYLITQNEDNSETTIFVDGQSNTETEFICPMKVNLYLENGNVVIEDITINHGSQVFTIETDSPLDSVIFDEENWVFDLGFVKKTIEINDTWSANTQIYFDLSGTGEGYLYNLYRSTELNGTFEKVNEMPLNTQIYIDKDLEPNQTYYYKISIIPPEFGNLEFFNEQITTISTTNFSLDQGVLIIDETEDGDGSVPNQPTDQQVDDFYSTVIENTTDENITIFDFEDDFDNITLEVLGNYKAVIWHDDDLSDFHLSNTFELQDMLANYVFAGGKLLITGMRTFRFFELNDYFEYDLYNTCNNQKFVFGAGEAGYPDLEPDLAKIPDDWNGNLRYVSVLETASPDMTTLVSFIHEDEHEDFYNKPCILRNDAEGKEYIISGIPLYFCKQEQVAEFFAAVFNDFGIPSAVDNLEVSSKGFAISNYPNPFSHETIIEYSIPESDNVSLHIYNMNGQLVKTLVNEIQAKGHYSITWNTKDSKGNSVKDGVYFCKLKTSKNQQMGKMILLTD